MTKQEMIMAAIEANGYKPQIDDDGDIYVRYQLKTIYFFTEPDDDQYVVALLSQFAEVNEGEEVQTLAVCNKVTREIKLAKVFIDQTFKNVSACCEFFYTDSGSLKVCVLHSLNVLGIVRSTFAKMMAEEKEG